MLELRRIATVAAVLIMVAAGSRTLADVLPVEGVTVDMGAGGGSLSAVMIDGEFLADLALPTSATADVTRTAWNNTGGTDPVTANTALSNAILTDGVLNTNATFQFGRSVGLDETLVFIELERNAFGTFGDTVTFLPVDSGGNTIGNYALTISDDGSGGSDQYGPPLIDGNFDLKIVDVVDPIDQFNVRGVSFTLGDLVGSTGNLALAQGFRVEDNSGNVGVDPAYAAIASVLPPNTDFDGLNGTDIADFNILRTNYLVSGLTQADGDANGDGVVDHTDYFLWRTDFLAAGGSLAGLSLTVPEPTGAAMAGLLACVAAIGRQARRHRVNR